MSVHISMRSIIMIRFLSVAFVAIGAAAFAASPEREHSPPPPAERELRTAIREMLDAVAPGDAHVWRRYLHDRLIHVDENGALRGKAELLKEFTPLPAGLVGRMEIDRFKMETHGDVALASYEIQEYLDYHGQMLRSRFRASDAWMKTPAGWRLLSQQVSAVLKDPPAVTLSETQLCAYNGAYALTDTITTTVRCTQDGLQAERAGRPPLTYLPEVLDVFFVPGQPRTRRIFLRDAQGAVTAFVDRREGEDVRWMRRP